MICRAGGENKGRDVAPNREDLLSMYSRGAAGLAGTARHRSQSRQVGTRARGQDQRAGMGGARWGLSCPWPDSTQVMRPYRRGVHPAGAAPGPYLRDCEGGLAERHSCNRLHRLHRHGQPKGQPRRDVVQAWNSRGVGGGRGGGGGGAGERARRTGRQPTEAAGSRLWHDSMHSGRYDGRHCSIYNGKHNHQLGRGATTAGVRPGMRAPAEPRAAGRSSPQQRSRHPGEQHS